MSDQELIPYEVMQIAELMAEYNGDVVKVSRDNRTMHNAMSLRRFIADTPEVRKQYHILLTGKLQESGLHITERILKMVEMQNRAFGDPDNSIPPDPKTAIALSREISTLIAEGKGQSVSGKNALLITSKEGAEELLQAFLDS